MGTIGDERLIYRVVADGPYSDQNPRLVAIPVRETELRYYPIEEDRTGTAWQEAFGPAKFIQKRSGLYETSPHVAVAKALAKMRKTVQHMEVRLEVARDNLAVLEGMYADTGMVDLRGDGSDEAEGR